MSKRGRLSNYDKKFINNNCTSMTDVEIARKIGRSVDAIKTYRLKLMVKGNDLEQKSAVIADIKNDLITRLEWKQLKQEFTAEELDYFKHRYSLLLSQFKDDVLATEDMQIFLAIKL